MDTAAVLAKAIGGALKAALAFCAEIDDGSKREGGVEPLADLLSAQVDLEVALTVLRKAETNYLDGIGHV